MPPQQHQTKALQDQLKILQALSTRATFANSNEVASLVDLPIETVRTYLKRLCEEGYLLCRAGSDIYGNDDHNCRIADQGRAAPNSKGRSSKPNCGFTKL